MGAGISISGGAEGGGPYPRVTISANMSRLDIYSAGYLRAADGACEKVRCEPRRLSDRGDGKRLYGGPGADAGFDPAALRRALPF